MSQANHPWVWVAFVTSTALALRLYQLGTESLWIDEGYSLSGATSISMQDVRPLYHMLLALWLHLGQSEFILRLPSVLFGISAVPVVYLLGRRLAGERAALTAAGLIAVSPLHVNHSQEIRMYSLVTLLTLLAMYEFMLFLDLRKVKHLVGYLVFTMLSIATFPPTALLLVVQNAAALRRLRRHDLWRWSGAQLLMVAPCIPLLWYAIRVSGNLSPESATSLSVLDVIGLTGSFSLGGNGHSVLGWYAHYTYAVATLALVTAAVVVRLRERGKTGRDNILLLLLWLAIPILLTAELVRLTGAQWLPRYVIYASPAYFLLIGASVDVLGSRRLQYLAVAAIFTLPIVKLVRYYEIPMHPQWREAVRFIERHEQPEDVIAIYRPGNGYVFDFYYRGHQAWYEIGWPKLQGKRPWTEQRAASVIGELPSVHRRVWLVMSQHDPEAGVALEGHVRGRYQVLDRRSYKGVEIILFRDPTRPDAAPP